MKLSFFLADRFFFVVYLSAFYLPYSHIYYFLVFRKPVRPVVELSTMQRYNLYFKRANFRLKKEGFFSKKRISH
jgi:hypothetical protein